MKKVIALVLVLVMVLTACQTTNESTSENKTESQNADKIKIGILQFAQHASLDNCRTGVIEGLKEEGFEEDKNLIIDYQNADADTGICSQIADSFVANKYDMIIAIATPAAMSAYNAAMDSNIPVVYTAINDPVEAQLAGEDKMPLGNATGTSDALPIDEQLKMIREILPDAKKLGIMHTSGEVNSTSNIEKYKELAPKYGFELVTQAVTQTSDIPLATDSILKKVDCMTNITDNTVVNSLPTILDKANEKNIPVFGSEIEQVKIGCLASAGIEYISLGNDTGKMAAEILKGEKEAKDMPFKTIQNSTLYINDAVSKNLGIEIPESMREKAEEIFDSINY